MKTKIHWNRLNRQIHYWGALVCALPVLVMIVSGLFLLFKKDIAWIQPPTQRGVAQNPSLTFPQILEAAKGAPNAGIESWDDIDRLDVRPGKGVVKVRANNRWEVQVDLETGEILQVAYRRSDLIESIHDGSFFHDAVKLWLFLPAAVVLLVLWITGIYLFLLPQWSKWRRKRKQQIRVAPTL